MAQMVTVRVHAGTGCALYNSCKRNPFVASVSAMGSTAGFLNFQGHNALDGGHQYISMNFSNNLNDSLAFSDSLNDYTYEDLNLCNYTTDQSEIHTFPVNIPLYFSILPNVTAIVVIWLVKINLILLNIQSQICSKDLMEF